MHKKSLKV